MRNGVAAVALGVALATPVSALEVHLFRDGKMFRLNLDCKYALEPVEPNQTRLYIACPSKDGYRAGSRVLDNVEYALVFDFLRMHHYLTVDRSAFTQREEVSQR